MCYIDINDIDVLLELRALQRKPMSIRAMRMAKAGGADMVHTVKRRDYVSTPGSNKWGGHRAYILNAQRADVHALVDEAWQLLYDGWLATAGTASDAAIWEAYRAREDS
jgi:hypothetical protein